MVFLTDPRMATVSLTRHGQWTHEIRVDPGKVWPDGTTTIVFYDSRGGVITTLAGTVDPQNIRFSSGPEDTDPVPAGAGFEIFLQTDDGPYKIRYGRVIRKEIAFPAAPGSVINPSDALQFSDNFQRTALGSRWIGVLGRTVIHQNEPDPDGVGPEIALFYQQSAIRYYAPLNGDNPKVGVNLLYPGTGKTTVMLSADQAMTSYLGLQFETSSSGTDKIHIATGNGSPVSMTVHNEVAVTLADFDNYTIFYNNLTRVAMIYKGTDTTPLVEWADEGNLVPHGPGYRYLGFSFQCDLFTTGPQITNWIAQDDVSVLDAEEGS